MIKNVLKLEKSGTSDSGTVLVFNENDEPISEYQGRYEKVRGKN